jgi:hypothetical protein
MSNLSLQASIRTCQVQTGEATRIESDRFLNPMNMVCPIWGNQDLVGRNVCADSFYTKSAGCNSATDRVYVENDLRPQYMEYINLNAAGIGLGYSDNMNYTDAGEANTFLKDRNKYTGNFGSQFQANVVPTCGLNSYDRAMQETAQANRSAQNAQAEYFSNQQRIRAGR